jgi:hypothetical protein
MISISEMKAPAKIQEKLLPSRSRIRQRFDKGCSGIFFVHDLRSSLGANRAKGTPAEATRLVFGKPRRVIFFTMKTLLINLNLAYRRASLPKLKSRSTSTASPNRETPVEVEQQPSTGEAEVTSVEIGLREIAAKNLTYSFLHIAGFVPAGQDLFQDCEWAQK